MLTDPEVLFSPHDAQVVQDRNWGEWFWLHPSGVQYNRRLGENEEENNFGSNYYDNDYNDTSQNKIHNSDSKADKYTSLTAYGFDASSGWNDLEENMKVMNSFATATAGATVGEAKKYEHPLRHLSEWDEEVRFSQPHGAVRCYLMLTQLPLAARGFSVVRRRMRTKQLHVLPTS